MILFVTQFFPSPNGSGNTGGTISNINMLRTLAKKHAVKVLAFDPEAAQDSFADEPFQVVLRPAPGWRAPGLLCHWLDFVRAETHAAICTAPSLDALIATTSTLAAFDVCPPSTTRIALVQAYENFGLGCRWVPASQRINLGKLAAVRRFQDGRMLRNSDAILTNSQFMKGAISKRFGVEAARIYVTIQACGVDGAEAAAPEGTIGFVNRSPEKGLSFVMDLAMRSPDLRYLIYGHERGRPNVLPSNVDWRGWASNRSAMFASAKLWLVPSRWAEPFGRVSIEAQGSDRAVLVASTGGLVETVTDPQFCIFGFDADLWLARIRSLLQLAPDEIDRNGAQVRERFSSTAHDCRLLSVMENILSNKGKRTRASTNSRYAQ